MSADVSLRWTVAITAAVLVLSADVPTKMVLFGDANLVRSNFTDAISQHKVALVAFVAPWCQLCRTAEQAYANVTRDMNHNTAAFFRVDAGSEKRLAADYGVSTLPHVVLFRETKPVEYKQRHDAALMLRLLEKHASPPSRNLPQVSDVKALIRPEPPTEAVLIAFFSDTDSQDSEYEEWQEALPSFAFQVELEVAEVTNRKVSNHFRKEGVFKYTPSVVLWEGGEVLGVRRLDEWHDAPVGAWISSLKTQGAIELTPQSYPQLEKRGLPMLLMFVDFSADASESAIQELKQLSQKHEFRGLISFAYADGTKYGDKMAGLGIRHSHLPVLAFNTRGDQNYVYPRSKPLLVAHMRQFCLDFLGGRAAPPEELQEGPEPSGPQEPGLINVNYKSWHRAVEDPTKDVAVLVHRSKGCEACDQFQVYYTAVARRFWELEISSLVIAQIDLEATQIPTVGKLALESLPAILMFSAKDKELPKVYAGKGKPRPIMLWMQQQVDLKFELPELPHLRPDQRVEYHRQMSEIAENKEKAQVKEKAEL